MKGRFLAVLMLFLTAGPALAVGVEYRLVPLGGERYRYDYTLFNDGALGPATALSLIDLLFDPAGYDEGSLANASAPALAAQWDQSFLAAAPGVPAAFDIFATGGGLAPGERLAGFAVEFLWRGAGTPGAQPFSVADPLSFATLIEGQTTPVPEPRAWLLLAAGALALAVPLRRRRALAAAGLLALAAQAAQAAPALSVARLELVSQTRIDRFNFDYAYRVVVANAGSDAKDVEAGLTGTPAGVTALAGRVHVGTIGAGQERASTGLLRLRHDRRQPFAEAALRWLLLGQDGAFTGTLRGTSGEPALGQTFNYFERPAAPVAYLADASGAEVASDELVLEIAAGASVGEINAALSGHGARIAAMLAGRSKVALALAPAASFADLELMRASLAAQPGVASVALSHRVQPTALPANPPFADPRGQGFIGNATFTVGGSNRIIDHHLAVRGHGVWNLWNPASTRNLLDQPALRNNRPVLIYFDFFGSGAPNALWNVDTLEQSYTTNAPNDHGYAVMSVVSADYGGDASDEGMATGLYPARLNTWAIDHGRPAASSIELAATIDTLRNIGGQNIIVNSSVAVCAGDADVATGCRVTAHRMAVDWIDRAAPLQNGFLHVTAAGNAPSLWAYETGEFTGADAGLATNANPLQPPGRIARLKPDLTPLLDGAGNPVLVDKLANIITVEARENLLTGFSGAPFDRVVPPVPGCPAAYSSIHGSLGGIGGEDNRVIIFDPAAPITIPAGERAVFTLSRPGAPGARLDGTSFATPQVSAIAAWVWSLAPQLAVADVKRLVLASAMRSPAASCTRSVADFGLVADAFAAALATDNPHYNDPNRNRHLARSTAAPVRRFLLDVASADPLGNLSDQPDGRFTQADILKLVMEFEKRRGDQTPDYSRFDLNGSGVTGEPPARTDIRDVSRFDLDGDLQWTPRTELAVEGVTKAFPEDQTADIEVLIYYAFSELYEGSEYERTLMLLPYLPKTSLEALFLDTLAIAVPPPNLRATTFRMAQIDSPATGFASLCGAERGTPLFSAQVAAEAATRVPFSPLLQYMRPIAQAGRLGEQPANAVNCSSFVVALQGSGLVWINSAGRFVGTNPTRDEEYQTRFFLGLPDLTAGRAGGFVVPPRRLATQTMTYGIVASPSGPFAPVFTTRNFALNQRGYLLAR